MKIKNDPEWLKKMAESEGNGCVSVGGLYHKVQELENTKNKYGVGVVEIILENLKKSEFTPNDKEVPPRAGLLMAAICYATHAWKQEALPAQAKLSQDMPPLAGHLSFSWPYTTKDWQPSDDPIGNLAKAGALIAAEIERLTKEKYKDKMITADGEHVVHRDSVWHPSWSPSLTVREDGTAYVPLYGAEYPVSECYSSEEAAQEVRKV
jgi:hypothetical protein